MITRTPNTAGFDANLAPTTTPFGHPVDPGPAPNIGLQPPSNVSGIPPAANAGPAVPHRYHARGGGPGIAADADRSPYEGTHIGAAPMPQVAIPMPIGLGAPQQEEPRPIGF